MADLSSILADPNYVNANAATKQAIFDKFSANDTNFTGANPATQDAIRVKFGLTSNPDANLAQSGGGIPGPRKTGANLIPTEPGANLAPTIAPKQSAMDIARGVIETPAAIAATMLGGPITYLSGIAGPEVQRKVAANIQYQPRTQMAQDVLESIARNPVVEKLPPFMPAMGLSRTAVPAARTIGGAVGNEAEMIREAVQAPFAARAAKTQETNVAKSYQNAGRIDAATEGAKIGLVGNPAEMNPTAGNRLKAYLIDPKTINAAATKVNDQQVPKIALNEMGLPPNTALTSDVPFNMARDAASGPYKEIARLPSMTAAPEVIKSVETLRPSKLVLGKDRAAALNEIIDSSLQDMSGGLTGAETVKSISDLRAQAQNINNAQKAGHPLPASELDKVKAYRGIADALEQMIEDNVRDPKLLSDLRDARVKIAKIHAYEDATDFNLGKINPAEIAKLTAKNPRLTGDIATIGHFAGNFPEAMGVTTPETMAAMAKRTISRATLSGATGAALGAAVGAPVAGLAAGAALGELGSNVMANRMVGAKYQAAKAIPQDFRPPVNNLRPAEINYGPNQLAPFDPRNAVLMPGEGPYNPNFTGVSEPIYSTSFGQRGLPNEVPKQIYQAQKNAELAQELRAVGERKPVRGRLGGENLVFDAAGNLVPETPAPRQVNIIGAPTSLDNAVQKLSGQIIEQPSTTYKTMTVSPKTGAQPYTRIIKKEGETTFERGVPRAFDLTATEKIAWDKAKADLAEVAPGFKSLTDKAIAQKMMDRAWIQDTITKAREKAAMFDDISKRVAGEQAKRDAAIKRDQMLDVLATLEERLRAERPDVSGKQQGPKTRAAKRNALAPDNQNNLAPPYIEIRGVGSTGK